MINKNKKSKRKEEFKNINLEEITGCLESLYVSLRGAVNKGRKNIFESCHVKRKIEEYHTLMEAAREQGFPRERLDSFQEVYRKIIHEVSGPLFRSENYCRGSNLR